MQQMRKFGPDKRFARPFPVEKYKFDVKDNIITANTTYANKAVKAVAKCDPQDAFDVEYGKRLAAARCNLKVAVKRANDSNAKVKRMEKEIIDLVRSLAEAEAYADKANRVLVGAVNSVKDIEAESNK